MARIVLGIGTSHGPMLVTKPEQWASRIAFDKAVDHAWRGGSWRFEQLLAERSDQGFEEQITPQAMAAHEARCQAALDELADRFAKAGIDVAVIIGNDQMEIFDERLIPAFSVFYGEDITNYEFPPERLAKLPPGIEQSLPGYIPGGGAVYPGQSELARSIIGQAMADGFDVAAMKELPKPETPHAFGFVYRRIMRDNPVPSVPVLVNTFYPPNQPTVQRCHDFGRSVLRGIEAWESDARVAVFASGGLSHFVIDEGVDRLLLDAIMARDIGPVADLGEAVFQDGTSEIKNWVPLVGMMAELGLEPEIIDYVPCYRSAAGTGNAMGFVCWR
ncbi:MAG: protocatechuate 3,4-dioxygenase [Sphingobium sp. 32-64-5]|nr:MAG: protocatechuate 3,4-dioxygenase [Sphingobium sp. 32-64-5]